MPSSRSFQVGWGGIPEGLRFPDFSRLIIPLDLRFHELPSEPFPICGNWPEPRVCRWGGKQEKGPDWLPRARHTLTPLPRAEPADATSSHRDA